MQQNTELFEQPPCPICGSDSYRPFLQVADRFRPEERFRLVRCTSCGLIYLNPRPTEQAILKYYQAADYDPHSEGGHGLSGKLYRLARFLNTLLKLHWLSSFSGPRRALDVGCGTGYFLQMLRKKGWEVAGVEPVPVAQRLAQQKGLNVVSRLDEAQGPFGVITLWHVLEHLHNPADTLRQLDRLLAADGWLLLSMPNPLCLDAQYFGPSWVAYDAPRHLVHYRPQDVEHLARQTGFTIFRLAMLPFDPVYNVFLSLQQSTSLSLSQIISGPSMGIRSLLDGIRHPKLASSPVYFFRKTKN
jgi:SAM-dependent methyltransferase